MMGRRESNRAPWPVASALWIAGTLSLLAPPFVRWMATPVSLAVPSTPVDRVNGLYARLWTLVHEASAIVPAGQSFTAVAKDKDEEMILFMLSVGALRGQYPVPSSYWERPMAEGDRARFVVSYECVEPSGAPRLVRRFAEGCVWERSDPAR